MKRDEADHLGLVETGKFGLGYGSTETSSRLGEHISRIGNSVESPDHSYGHCIGMRDSFFAMCKGTEMGLGKLEVLQGTSEVLLNHDAEKQLKREAENWERVAGVMERVLKLERQG